MQKKVITILLLPVFDFNFVFKFAKYFCRLYIAEELIAKLGCESLRVYFVADNVALLSARKGYDPRTNWNGESNYNYSALRSISGGITMKF